MIFLSEINDCKYLNRLNNMAIWFKEYSVALLNEFNKNSLGENLGIEFIAVNENSVVATMPVDSRTVQPYRILHGGASAALAETLGSVASMMCLDVEKQIPVGLELNINHLRSETTGKVTGYCEPIHLGKSTHVWGIEIKNAEEKLVATSRLTVMILEKK
jgi:1,4-dihydroxy-2-naphthoyl-CoA hydrolase